MVVIEPAKEEPAQQQKPTASAEPPHKGGTTTPEAEPVGYSSEGYQTAGEDELSDADGDERTRDSDRKNENAGADAVGSDVTKEEQLEEKSESDQNEINEKALAKANEAKLEGNSLFKEGLYEEALLKYDLAIQTAPEGPLSAEIRSMCYGNRAVCYFKLGKFAETVKECTKALELNPAYLKALLKRAEAREKLEEYEDAIADLTKVLELDQSQVQARRSIIRLKPLADEKREKMKEEMIGKLKEMGNSILGRFGMSVDNFKAVKDPNTGSYSVSFQR